MASNLMAEPPFEPERKMITLFQTAIELYHADNFSTVIPAFVCRNLFAFAVQTSYRPHLFPARTKGAEVAFDDGQGSGIGDRGPGIGK